MGKGCKEHPLLAAEMDNQVGEQGALFQPLLGIAMHICQCELKAPKSDGRSSKDFALTIAILKSPKTEFCL